MNWLLQLFLTPSDHPDLLSSMRKITELPNGGVMISMNKEHGLVGDKHFSDCVEDIKQLKRELRYEEAISLLLNTINATEHEASVAGTGWGVAPWYYEQLAIIYRKQGRINDEIAILERYDSQEKSIGDSPQRLKERLVKAKALLVKKSNNNIKYNHLC